MGEAKRRREYLARVDEDAQAAAIQAQVHKTHAWWEARGQVKNPYLRVGTIEGKAPGINRRTYRRHKATGGTFVPKPPPSSTSPHVDSKPTLERGLLSETPIITRDALPPMPKPQHTCEVKPFVHADGTKGVSYTDCDNCPACKEDGPPAVLVEGSPGSGRFA